MIFHGITDFSRESLLYLTMARILTSNVHRNDATSFKPEMICTANCGFGGKKTNGKGIENVL
jgi:hypothetical protein